jgi:MFS family permease
MDSRSKRVGLYLSVAAVFVNMPRLILAYRRAEVGEASPYWHAGLLTICAIATGLVLTGGAAYLAHEVAVQRRLSLAVIWVLVLLATAVIVTPLLVASVGRELSGVIPSLAWRWVWSAVAVLAVELVASGCMVAVAGVPVTASPPTPAHMALARRRRSGGIIALELNPAADARESLVRINCRNGCGWSGPSRAAERGHQGQCPRRGAEASPAGVRSR